MIHDEHPFSDPEEWRDPVRKFRGRLSAAVTVVTSGPEGSRAGLTVSSLMVVEGDHPTLLFLCGPASELWDVITETGTFVVHVLEQEHRQLADRFAGVRPSPGGPFQGLDVRQTPHGPVLAEVGTRAYCRFTGHRDLGPVLLVEAAIEQVELHDLTRPLQYFRGRYLDG